uniref:Reverse transcriptase domain-containing protein n=1 Tax=Aegilops tauschii subsp. strangulata TaxID=200361 RepID=A0A453S8V7_AEGTS
VLGAPEERGATLNLAAIGYRSFDHSAMEQPFPSDEIWKAIRRLPSGKAPGPDGFTAEFLRACWQIIKDDFC